MAVFKPTNCSPYLTAFDITYLDEGPIYFQCKIDTSNTKIDGYAITIYDSDNNQVFPYGGQNAINNISYIDDLNTDTQKVGSIIETNGITDLNTGLNGTYLKIPFVVKQSDFNDFSKTTTTVINNMVYYDSVNKVVKDKSNKMIALTNGYQYKWSITLYQLGGNVSEPTDDRYYDMTIANGKILGSTNERIQSYPSDQIYNDYFIQLYQYNGLKIGDDYQISENISEKNDESNSKPIQFGTRVRIKDYDSYLGHIYPQIGQDGFAPEQIQNSNTNVFRVFKMSNNPDNLSAKDKVDFCITNKYFVPKYFFNSSSNSSVSYLQQTFFVGCADRITNNDDITNAIKGVYKKPFAFCLNTIKINEKPSWVSKEKTGGYEFFARTVEGVTDSSSPSVVFDQTRIVLNTEYGNFDPKNNINGDEIDEDGVVLDNRVISGSIVPNTSTSSGYNGIWIPKTPTINLDNNFKYGGNTYYKVTIQWYRSSDADTFGELTNKVVLDTHPNIENWDGYAGDNVQAYPKDSEGKPVTTGTINETPVKFNLEQAVEIYPQNEKEKYYAPIYKNNMSINNQISNTNIAFIGPSTAISVGDKIFNNSNNSSKIQGLNTTVWAIQYSNNIKFDTTNPYFIKTFFRSSSENQFSLYERPTVDLKLQGVSGGAEIEIDETYNTCETKERSIFAQATYNQTNLVQWRNYQWFLYDIPNVYEGDDAETAYKNAAESALTKYLSPNNLILQSEVGYDKEIKYTFYGLAEEHHWYIISLVLTDQYGTIITKKVAVYTDFTVELEQYKDWVNYGLRCDLTGVDMWFEDKYGYIYPNLGDRNYLIETNNNYANNPNGVTYSGSVMSISDYSDGVLYDSVYSNDGLSSWNSPSKQNLTFDQTKGIEFTTRVTIDSYQYSAEFLNVVINTDGGNTKNLVLKPEDLYISSNQWPEGYKVGFPNYECYKIGDYAIGKNPNIYVYGNATTDLFPASYNSYIKSNNYYISYIPSNVVPLGANKLSINDPNSWYFINYDETNNVEDVISNNPIKIDKMIYEIDDIDALYNKDVFYNLPIFINNDLKASNKSIENLPQNTKVYSLWMDQNDEIIIPTIVAINEQTNTIYYCYRKVKNKQENIRDNIWEDTNENGEDNIWEDEITIEDIQSEHLRNQDGSLNTIRNRLYSKTLSFYVQWSGKESDNITYGIDGNVSQRVIDVDSELSLTSANPVENRAITTALNSKLNTTTLSDQNTFGTFKCYTDKFGILTFVTGEGENG